MATEAQKQKALDDIARNIADHGHHIYVVIGDVKARVITVKGTVEGDLEATESIVVSPTANVIGDLVAPRVSVVEGATFNGAVRMVKSAAADAAKAAPAADGVLADKTVDKMLGG